MSRELSVDQIRVCTENSRCMGSEKQRYLKVPIENLALKFGKMAFISGPRQSGKTTLSRQIMNRSKNTTVYYNWDEKTFRKQWTLDPGKIISASSEQRNPVVVFDEIHKAKGWKSTLKGVYDSLTRPVRIIVTGSARLDVHLYQKY